VSRALGSLTTTEKKGGVVKF